MKRSKSDGESVDRVSELPASLILEILSSLEMRDVVRTSLVSKRWRDVWTTTPYLCFDESAKNSVQTRNFINRVLVRWKGIKIKKFRIRLREDYDDGSLFGDMDFWIRFATEWKVEELYIRCPYSYRPNYKESDRIYLPPHCLYSCSSITNLWLIGLNLDQMKVNLGLQWNQLKNLMIHGYYMSEDVINQVVSSTPQLEILRVLFVGSGQNLSIRSSSLKVLHLLNLWQSEEIRFDYDPSNYTALTIWAPNLKVLAINSRVAYSRCLLMDVSSLSEATLKVEDACEVAVEAIPSTHPTC